MKDQYPGSFDIEVDLEGNGEKSRLHVIPGGENYELLLNGAPYATLTHDGEFWILIEGDVDMDTVVDIGNAIDAA